MTTSTQRTGCGTNVNTSRNNSRLEASPACIATAPAPRVAEQFRTCEPGPANAALLDLLTGLQHLLAFLSQIRDTWAFPGDPLNASGDAFRDISAGLDALHACQERRDWPALAGQLESGLLPPLRGLDGILQGMIHDA